MRIIDAKESENKYGKKKLEYKYEFVDTEARNTFKSKNVTLSMIKYAHGFNHFRLRDSMINNNIIKEYYSRYDSMEMQDYMV